MELLHQHRLAERRVTVHVRGATFHIVHPGAAGLPDGRGDGMLIKEKHSTAIRLL